MRLGMVIMAGLVVPVCLQSAEGEAPVGRRIREMLESGSEPVRIVGFGDSITGVYYHSGGIRAWPGMLEVALRHAAPNADVTVYNAGVSGNTTTAGLKRIQKDVLDRKPHLVVVMFGMNDCAYGEVAKEVNARRLASLAENLETIVTMCREIGSEVILCTPNTVYPEAAPRRPPQRLAEVAEVVRGVGRDAGVPIVDMYVEWERARKENPRQWRLWMSETIHPAMAGHRRLAEMVAGVILGGAVSLDGALLAPPLDTLAHKLKSTRPLNVICPKELENGVSRCLREMNPKATIAFEAFPMGDGSLASIEKQTRALREKRPDLVLVSLPASALSINDEETFIRSASWVINWSLPFGKRTWDVVGISPRVIAPDADVSDDAELLLREIANGHDLHWITRDDGDRRAPEHVIAEWLGTNLVEK